MTDKKFAIVITAVDQFSKTFQKALKSVLSLDKPILETQKNVKNIDKDRKVRTLTDDVKDMSGALKDAGGALSSLIPGLEVIGGIGSLGALALGTSQLANYSQKALNASNITGIAVDKLQALEATVQAFGGKEGDATETVHQLGLAVNLAAAGLNPLLKNMMLLYHIKPSTDTMEVLRQFIDVYDRLRKQGTTPATLEELSNVFHAGGIQPLLTRTTAERNAALASDRARPILTQHQAEVGDRFAKAFTGMGNWLLSKGASAMAGVGDSIDFVGDLIADPGSPGAAGRASARGEGASAVIGGRRAAWTPSAGAAAPAAPRPATPVAPLLPSEKVEQYLDRRDAARNRDFFDEFRRANPGLFAPTTYMPVREPPKVQVVITVNGAPQGASATTTVDGAVEATTRFGHFLSPIM